MADSKQTPPSAPSVSSPSSEDSGPDGTGRAESARSGRTFLRWAALALAVILFGVLMRSVLYPYPNQSYAEISHGDHTHYVPKDRNETVPISNFPTREPGPNERITPDGNIISEK